MEAAKDPFLRLVNGPKSDDFIFRNHFRFRRQLPTNLRQLPLTTYHLFKRMAGCLAFITVHGRRKLRFLSSSNFRSLPENRRNRKSGSPFIGLPELPIPYSERSLGCEKTENAASDQITLFMDQDDRFVGMRQKLGLEYSLVSTPDRIEHESNDPECTISCRCENCLLSFPERRMRPISAVKTLGGALWITLFN